MIVYVERNTWTVLHSGKKCERWYVHHSSKQVFHYGPTDSVPKSVKEFMETAKLDAAFDLPGDGVKTNRKYERFIKA